MHHSTPLEQQDFCCFKFTKKEFVALSSFDEQIDYLIKIHTYLKELPFACSGMENVERGFEQELNNVLNSYISLIKKQSILSYGKFKEVLLYQPTKALADILLPSFDYHFDQLIADGFYEALDCSKSNSNETESCLQIWAKENAPNLFKRDNVKRFLQDAKTPEIVFSSQHYPAVRSAIDRINYYLTGKVKRDYFTYAEFQYATNNHASYSRSVDRHIELYEALRAFILSPYNKKQMSLGGESVDLEELDLFVFYLYCALKSNYLTTIQSRMKIPQLCELLLSHFLGSANFFPNWIEKEKQDLVFDNIFKFKAKYLIEEALKGRSEKPSHIPELSDFSWLEKQLGDFFVHCYKKSQENSLFYFDLKEDGTIYFNEALHPHIDFAIYSLEKVVNIIAPNNFQFNQEFKLKDKIKINIKLNFEDCLIEIFDFFLDKAQAFDYQINKLKLSSRDKFLFFPIETLSNLFSLVNQYTSAKSKINIALPLTEEVFRTYCAENYKQGELPLNENDTRVKILKLFNLFESNFSPFLSSRSTEDLTNAFFLTRKELVDLNMPHDDIFKLGALLFDLNLLRVFFLGESYPITKFLLKITFDNSLLLDGQLNRFRDEFNSAFFEAVDLIKTSSTSTLNQTEANEVSEAWGVFQRRIELFENYAKTDKQSEKVFLYRVLRQRFNNIEV